MISVIVPVFNAEATLSRALESVFAQSIDDWECIIVDNNSTDSSLVIAQEFTLRDPRFILIKCEYQGVSYARNSGLDASHGDLICFLDADDFFHQNSLEIRRDALDCSPDAVGVCTDYSVLLKSGMLRTKKRSRKNEIFREDLLIVNEIPMLTAMVKASKIRDIRFSPLGHEDYIFWLELLLHGKFINLTTITATYDSTIFGLSGNKFRAFRWHYMIMRNVLKFGCLKSILHSLAFLFIHIFRAFK